MRLSARFQLDELKLDLTPLFGVGFQLLLLFILSSSFVFQTGMRIELPASGFNEAPVPGEVIVGVTEDARLFFGETQTTLEGIRLQFEVLARTKPETRIVIRADRNARHGLVVGIMGTALRCGLSRVAVATAQPAPEEGK